MADTAEKDAYHKADDRRVSFFWAKGYLGISDDKRAEYLTKLVAKLKKRFFGIPHTHYKENSKGL